MSAHAFGHAELSLFRCGIAGAAVLATQAVAALDAADAQHRTARIGTHHFDAAGPGLTDPDQLALAIDVQHRGAGKQPDHLHHRCGHRQRRQQQQASEKKFKATHGSP